MRARYCPEDYAALETYLPQFIARCAIRAEGDLARRRREIREQVAIKSESNRSLPVAARIPYAVELWISHLATLDAMAELAAAAGITLAFEELRGLAILRRAREKFWSEHEKCPQCGAMNNRGAAFCGGCAAVFRPITNN